MLEIDDYGARKRLTACMCLIFLCTGTFRTFFAVVGANTCCVAEVIGAVDSK